ncbi:MAG TPA: response regulator [Candidatus Obscuribacterales bacterium]
MARHILVASNRSSLGELVKSALQSLEYNVELARDVSLALYLAHKNLPDIILADHQMMGGSGLDFLRELKADEELHVIPILFVSDTEYSAAAAKELQDLGVARVLNEVPSLDQLFLELMPYLSLNNHESRTRPPSSPE